MCNKTNNKRQKKISEIKNIPTTYIHKKQAQLIFNYALIPRKTVKKKITYTHDEMMGFLSKMSHLFTSMTKFYQIFKEFYIHKHTNTYIPTYVCMLILKHIYIRKGRRSSGNMHKWLTDLQLENY